MILTMGILLIPGLNSCKKGEGDPAISFKSRDARLCQTWVLTKIEGTKVSNGISTTFSYNGTTYSEVRSDNTSEKATGTYELTMDKHGSLSYSETYLPDGGVADNESGTGRWVWVDSDKDKSYIYILDGGQHLFYSNIFYCYKLSSKELIFKLTYSYIENGDPYSYDKTFTFERK